MVRRCTILLPIALATFFAVACGGSSGSSDDFTVPTVAARFTATPEHIVDPDATGTRAPTPTFVPTHTPTLSPTREPTPTVAPTPVPIVRSGADDARVDVELAEGLALVTLRHFGQGRFQARLLTASGEARSQIASDRGAFQGSRAVGIMESNHYIIEIVADGDWELEITRPIPETSIIRDLPLEVSGTGTQAIYFVKATPGLHTVSLTHDGSRTFNVAVMNNRARRWDRIVQTTGPFTGTAAISVRDSPFEYLIFDIRADGNWTMTVE